MFGVIVVSRDFIWFNNFVFMLNFIYKRKRIYLVLDFSFVILEISRW